jgi:hypothetical protein
MNIQGRGAVISCALVAVALLLGCKGEPADRVADVEPLEAPSPAPGDALLPPEATPLPAGPTPVPPLDDTVAAPEPVAPGATAPSATTAPRPAATLPPSGATAATPPPAAAQRTPTPQAAAPPAPARETPAPPAPAAAAAAADSGPGAQLFVAQRCSTCHAVSSASIAAKSTSPKTYGGDLTGIGQRRARPSIEAVIRQQELVEGKKHLGKFSGSAEDLAALVDWLLAQR